MQAHTNAHSQHYETQVTYQGVGEFISILIMTYKHVYERLPGKKLPSHWSREQACTRDKRATNHHHRQWHELPNSQTLNSFTSGCR